jgi:hypothetical protein
MYRDRKLVKDTPLKIRFSQYDLEEIELYVEWLGGSCAAILHDTLMNAVEEKLQEIGISPSAKNKNNNQTRL